MPDPGRNNRIGYPRVFRGRQREQLAFPLGGVAAGCLTLGGRGELKDWWIFNRPNKAGAGAPHYAFPTIWAQAGRRKPVTRVLEARFQPPYGRGFSDLGSASVPGMPRLDSCTFTGEYPLATVDFEDAQLPVQVRLEAFTPFIPLDADDSGLPLAVLRYRVTNPGRVPATAAIAWSIENPAGIERDPAAPGRHNDHRAGDGVEGLLMRNPFLPAADPQSGSFALALMNAGDGEVSHLRGWPALWFQGPLQFWDAFSVRGRLDADEPTRSPVGCVCLRRKIAAGETAEYTFLLSWHFPNRTPKRCGWQAPKGHEDDPIGNFYCTRFADAWEVIEYAGERLPELERRTRRFLSAMRRTTLPAAVRDAAMANLSTLATPTFFRTADGAFHGFEGCADEAGCCFGNCNHVYAYEAATAHLFPALSRSFRQQQFGFLTDEQGRMDYRELLPYGIERFGIAAADGQMACIMKAYLDWRLGGDTAWLRDLWPAIKRALEFAWIDGGWDADADGVMEGVQHNTYDVEFVGPNPLCGIWYLGALRAAEEMARALGDSAVATRCRGLFRRGSRWIDAHLFNGAFYVQKIGAVPGDRVAKGLIHHVGTNDTENPVYQVGDGCFADQLAGQYFAQVAGLGLLLDKDHLLKALRAIYRRNYKRSLAEHPCAQRSFAVNDEAGMVLCEYPRGTRPETPFPYFAEVWSGVEYATAVLMMHMGMTAQGVELIESVRRRYDGERRNPWNQAECGYHYARAMAAWGAIPALSGFRYHAAEGSVTALPRIRRDSFSSFWSTATGWGRFSRRRAAKATRFTLSLDDGELAVRSITLRRGSARRHGAWLGGKPLACKVRRRGEEVTFVFADSLLLEAGDRLVLSP